MACFCASIGEERDLCCLGSRTLEVCPLVRAWSLPIEYVFLAGVVHRVCPGPPPQRRDFDYLRPLQFPAGEAYWLGFGPPVRLTEFDSPHPLQFREFRSPVSIDGDAPDL